MKDCSTNYYKQREYLSKIPQINKDRNEKYFVGIGFERSKLKRKYYYFPVIFYSRNSLIIENGQMMISKKKTIRMKKIDSITIKAFRDYVSYIEDNCTKQDIILFRGQDVDKALFPKIARINIKGEREDAEKQMFSYFKRQAFPLVEVMPENEWDWLALAQHHEMATRLLDWTTNPLAALWFAVRKPAHEENGVV